jgi:hypothetical protein
LTRIPDARRDLDWLAASWDDLMDSREKGTQRTWLHHRSSRETPINTGDELVTVHGLPAPLHLDVLDVIVSIVAWADETSENVAQTLGMDRLPHATSAYADPRPHLLHIADHLGPLFADEPEMAEVIADEAHERAVTAAKLLGLMTGGQRLDCDCPYCGVTSALTVVVREGSEPLIVCMGRCWLDADETGHAAWHGRRAWQHPDGWVQLAKMLEAA